MSERAEVMFRLRELIDANRKEIATLLTTEHGKVVSDAMGEVARGPENIEDADAVSKWLEDNADVFGLAAGLSLLTALVDLLGRLGLRKLRSRGHAVEIAIRQLPKTALWRFTVP